MLATLLNEQSILAQRDNLLVASAMTVASVGALILGTLLLQIPDRCTTSGQADCIAPSQQWLYFLAPLPVGALAAILVYLSLNSSLNSQLLHKVEKAIQDRVNFDLPPDIDRGEDPEGFIPLPASNTLTAILFSLRSSRSLILYRLGAILGAGLVFVLLMASVVAVLSRLTAGYRYAGVALYIGPTILLTTLFVRAGTCPTAES